MNKLPVLFLLTFFFGARLLANEIVTADTIQVFTTDCTMSVDVCLDFPLNQVANLQLFQNGQPYAGNISGCDFDTIVTYSYSTLFGLGNMGPYQLDSWGVNGTVFSGQFNTIDDLVDSMNVWNPIGNWVHQPAMLSIIGGASGNSYSDMMATALINNTPAILGMNFGLEAQGTQLNFEIGEHELVIVDAQNSCIDTVQILVNCLPVPQLLTFFDTIPADVNPYVLCLDTTQLPGNVVSIENVCPGMSGTFVAFTVSEEDFCVKYQGKKCDGEETACIVICDDMGFCDTTIMNIVVDNSACTNESEKIFEEVLINFSETFCIDTTGMPGTIVSIENVCPDDSGDNVDFEINDTTYCVTYMGFAIGMDTACIVLTDEFGNTDTTTFCITVIPPQTGTVVESYPCGQTMNICLEINELSGSIVSMENVCPDLSSESVAFDLNNVTLCVDATSLGQGIDTACIVICDEFGICDTTLIVVDVMNDCDPCNGELPPDAVNDTVTTLMNSPLNIEILANDTIPDCSPPMVSILEIANGGRGPNAGMLVLNVDNTVDYIPNAGFCGQDAFTYVLCNTVGCDTADVYIDVDCDPLNGEIEIHTGFSPNDDDTNDFFHIENIELFPNNDLKIYNRWGNLVFETEAYQNDWDGSFDGTPLPDGTYFYYLNLDGRREFSGFLELRR